MSFLAQIITWINTLTNTLGKFLLAPIGVLPGWLSNTIVSAATGVVLLIIFKYTSNQRAIGRLRDNIKANMLALKLFKDSISVTLQTQGQVFKGALLLLFHAIRPMLVMIVPVSLLLAQMSMWYQYRPLAKGEEAIVTIEINYNISDLSKVSIEPTTAMDIVAGPVKILSKSEVHWKINARENGYHDIVFNVGGQHIKKQLAVGEGFMRLSSMRPSWKWSDILKYPVEEPFGLRSPVRSISIDYPKRLSRTSGTDWWLVYFFVASLLFALIFKPFLKVRV